MDTYEKGSDAAGGLCRFGRWASGGLARAKKIEKKQKKPCKIVTYRLQYV
jgi:hypothetical protein